MALLTSDIPLIKTIISKLEKKHRINSLISSQMSFLAKSIDINVFKEFYSYFIVTEFVQKKNLFYKICNNKLIFFIFQPLHSFIENQKVLEYFLEKEKSNRQVNFKFWEIFSFACEEGNFEIVKLIEPYLKKNSVCFIRLF